MLSGNTMNFPEQFFALFFHKVCLVYSTLMLFRHKDSNESLAHGKPEEQCYSTGWVFEAYRCFLTIV